MVFLLLVFTITWLIIPALTVPFSLLGYVSNNKAQRILSLLFLVLFMAAMAMCFREPKTDPDIVRYIAAVTDYKGISFFQAFNHGAYENLYIIDIWYWAIAKTGNYQLIAGTSVFFTYLIGLYVLQDYADRKEFRLGQRVFSLLIFLGFLNFAFAVNALRSGLAFAMVLLAVYRELYQKRTNAWTYLLYVLPVFMHFAAIFLVLIRFVVSVKKRYVKIILMMLLFAPLLIESIAGIVNMLPSHITVVSYAQSSLNRVLMYFKWDSGGWASAVRDSGYYMMNKIFSYSVLAMMAIAFWKTRKRGKGQWSEKLENYFEIYFFVILACYFMQTPSYQRFTFALYPYGAALFGQYVGENTSRRITTLAFKGGVFCLAMIGYFLNFYMLNTMIPVGKFVMDVLTYSPLFSKIS